jgi:hypothetical protein
VVRRDSRDWGFTFGSVEVEVACLDCCYGWLDDVLGFGALLLAGFCTKAVRDLGL